MIVMASTITDETDEVVEPGVPVDLGPLPTLLGYALRRAQVAVFQDFHTRFAADDIRPAQYSVLKILQLNPGLRQTQVSAALGVKRTNFVPLFDGLEQRGLAERRPVAGDRRASALFLTDDGANLVERLDAKVAEHEKLFVARIGEQGKNQLIALAHRLQDPAFDP
jgi:DNA-binding MarR family transcriptional regulator